MACRTRTRSAIFGLVAAVASGTIAWAQNPFEIYPEYADPTATRAIATRFVAPTTVEPRTEIYQQVPCCKFPGVGARSSDCTCWISAVRVQLLDPVPTTPEKVYVRVLAGCSTPGGSTVIFQAPLPPPSGGFPSTPTTFTIPTGPLQVPCDGFFVGVYLPMPMPLGDGIRVLAAPYVGAIGDNPRPGSPGHAWYFDSGWQTSAHSLHFGVEVANPVLNMGNRDTPHRAVPFQDSYGAGGLYPDLARVAPVSSDQLLARVFDFPNPNALWLLLISVSGGGNCCTAMPVPIPLDAGCLYVLPDVVLGPYVLDAQGAGYLTFPPLTPAIQGLNVCFQAAVLPPTGLVRLSNAQSVSF